MPERLSFRRRRQGKAPARSRNDAARLSFARRKPRAPLAAGQDRARSLSFRRRQRRKADPAPREARALSFRRRRAQTPRVTEGRAWLKLKLFGRRPDRQATTRPPRGERNGLGIALRLAGLALATGILQLLVVSQVSVFGVTADLTPLVVAAAGFLCGSLPGACFGFGVGLFVDLAFVQTLGISSLLFTLIGYSAGRLRELRAPAAPLTRLVLGTAATVTALGGYGAIEFMLGINTPVSAGLLGAIIKTTVLNSAIAVPVYALTRRALRPALAESEHSPGATPATSGGLSPLSRA